MPTTTATLAQSISDDYLFTIKETSGYLRCSRTKLLQLRKDGKIKAVVSGGQILFARSEVTKYVSNNMEEINNG